MRNEIVLNTQKNSYVNQAIKNTCQIFLPKYPEWKISNPKKSFDNPRHLKSGVLPLGYVACHLKGSLNSSG